MSILDKILNETGVENAVTHQVANYLRKMGFKYNHEKCTPSMTCYVRHPRDPYEDKHDEVEIEHLASGDHAILKEIHTHVQAPNESIIELLAKHLEEK